MKRETLCAAVLATVTLAGSSSAQTVSAAPSPPERCRPASKLEYISAKKQFLLITRAGGYVRTGRMFARHYWYCRN
jgi:hypothetical protein